MEMLYVLNNKIEAIDNIFLYGSGEFSVDLMIYLLQLDISIKGFICDEIKDDRENIFNKAIVNVSELNNKDNVVVIIPSIYSDHEYSHLKSLGFKHVYWSSLYKKNFVKSPNSLMPKAFILNNKFLMKEKKIVYGSGISGKKWYKILRDEGINIDAFGDSSQSKWGSKIEEIEIIPVNQICEYEDNIGITVSPAYTIDIYNNFKKAQQKNCFLPPSKDGLYLENHIGIEKIPDIGVIQKIIDNSKDKKVIIYGATKIALKVYKILKSFSIEVEYLVDDKINPDCEITVKSIQDLLSENPQDLLIVIPDNQKKIYEKKIQNLKQLFEKVDYIYIGNSHGRICQYVDVDLGNNLEMDIMGFKKFSRVINEDNKIFRIVIFGNSTTYADYKWTIKSWSELLFNKISESKNINIEVLCGGINGYTSHDELIKLIRDGILLKPDMIISYSGVNDMGFIEGVENYPHTRPLRLAQLQETRKVYVQKHGDKVGDTVSLGITNEKKDYEFWLDNIRMMNAICREFDIKFLCFLQPTVLSDGYLLSQSERYMLREEFQDDRANEILQYVDGFYKNAIEIIKNYDYIIDFTNIFSNEMGLFFDSVHVNTKGNQIIADKMYESISHILD